MAKKEKPHFDISAYVVKQLGEELVSDEVTAVMELVKNAYDADASWVKIIIGTNRKLGDSSLHYPDHNGFIVIQDDGDGMNKNELTNGWLTISSSKKREMKRSGQLTEKKRTPQGDKGLGRLSAQRLGNRFEILTGKKDDTKSYHVGFDFDDFTEDTMLGEVPVKWAEIEKPKSTKGTKLTILDLKNSDDWTQTTENKIIGKLSQLISPYKDQRPFIVSLTINGKRQDLDTISDNLRQNAISQFEFSFDGQRIKVAGKIKLSKLRGGDTPEHKENFQTLLGSDGGEAFYNYLNSDRKRSKAYNLERGEGKWYLTFERTTEFKSVDKLSFIPKAGIATETEPANPGPFSGEVNEFYLTEESNDVLQGFNDFNAFRSLVKSQLGIKVYRDGFGVRPFGLDGNDWLHLSRGGTSINFYALRPNNIIGFIGLRGKENQHLREKTDREGFVDSPYSRNFHRIIQYAIVDEINKFLNYVRRGYNDYKGFLVSKGVQLEKLTNSFDLMRSMSKDAISLKKKTEDLDDKLSKGPLDHSTLRPFLDSLKGTLEQVSELNKVADVIRPRFEALQDQAAMFAQLAGLGMISEAVTHEIATLADRLAQQTDSLTAHLKQRNVVDIKLNVYVEYVHSAIAAMRRQIGHLAPSLRYVKDKKEVIHMGVFLHDLADFYRERLGAKNMQLIVAKPFVDFALETNKGRLTQIFDNLILNSEHWLAEYAKRFPGATHTITIKAPTKGCIQVYDSGLGFDPSIEELAFDPFITTKRHGRGLGLYIVQQLLEPEGCSIALQRNKNEHGRRFILQIDLNGALVDGTE
jgi:signal transduction histidine kinase